MRFSNGARGNTGPTTVWPFIRSCRGYTGSWDISQDVVPPFSSVRPLTPCGDLKIGHSSMMCATVVFRSHRDQWQTLLPVWLAAMTSPKLVANKASRYCLRLEVVSSSWSSSVFLLEQLGAHFHHDLTFLESPACFSVKEADCSWNPQKIETENAVYWRSGKMDERGFRVEI